MILMTTPTTKRTTKCDPVPLLRQGDIFFWGGMTLFIIHADLRLRNLRGLRVRPHRRIKFELLQPFALWRFKKT